MNIAGSPIAADACLEKVMEECLTVIKILLKIPLSPVYIVILSTYNVDRRVNFLSSFMFQSKSLRI